jgi:hypothetical protein
VGAAVGRGRRPRAGARRHHHRDGPCPGRRHPRPDHATVERSRPAALRVDRVRAHGPRPPETRLPEQFHDDAILVRLDLAEAGGPGSDG